MAVALLTGGAPLRCDTEMDAKKIYTDPQSCIQFQVMQRPSKPIQESWSLG